MIADTAESQNRKSDPVLPQSVRKNELATVGLGGLNNSMDITENQIRREQGLNLRASY